MTTVLPIMTMTMMFLLTMMGMILLPIIIEYKYRLV